MANPNDNAGMAEKGREFMKSKHSAFEAIKVANAGW